jgi:hypothetical protein
VFKAVRFKLQASGGDELFIGSDSLRVYRLHLP